VRDGECRAFLIGEFRCWTVTKGDVLIWLGRRHQTEMVASSVFRIRSLRAFDRYVRGAQHPPSGDVEFVCCMQYGSGAACICYRCLDTLLFFVYRLRGERRRRPVRPVQLPVQSSMSPPTTRRRQYTRRRRQHPVSIFWRHQEPFVRNSRSILHSI